MHEEYGLGINWWCPFAAFIKGHVKVVVKDGGMRIFVGFKKVLLFFYFFKFTRDLALGISLSLSSRKMSIYYYLVK